MSVIYQRTTTVVDQGLGAYSIGLFRVESFHSTSLRLGSLHLRADKALLHSEKAASLLLTLSFVVKSNVHQLLISCPCDVATIICTQVYWLTSTSSQEDPYFQICFSSALLSCLTQDQKHIPHWPCIDILGVLERNTELKFGVISIQTLCSGALVLGMAMRHKRGERTTQILA